MLSNRSSDTKYLKINQNQSYGSMGTLDRRDPSVTIEDFKNTLTNLSIKFKEAQTVTETKSTFSFSTFTTSRSQKVEGIILDLEKILIDLQTKASYYNKLKKEGNQKIDFHFAELWEKSVRPINAAIQNPNNAIDIKTQDHMSIVINAIGKVYLSAVPGAEVSVTTTPPRMTMDTF